MKTFFIMVFSVLTLWILPITVEASPQYAALISPDVDWLKYKTFYILDPLKHSRITSSFANLTEQEKQISLSYSKQTLPLAQKVIDYEGIKLLTRKKYVQVMDKNKADFVVAFAYTFNQFQVQQPGIIVGTVVGTSGNLIGSGGYTTLANVHGVHMFFGDAQTKEVFLRASYYRKHSHVDMERAVQSDMPSLGRNLPKQGYRSVSKKRKS